ncbi:hypothetical protein L484_024656 [Morus notabilis]|uniref:Polycomb protein VEFS-Box domain-containing protein n=1 Tax=Morus notabilis TaxID=981085 RepID=W9RDW6_9ROSA|nr:hypothetical protein L484_024656 [Morus notabilis]
MHQNLSTTYVEEYGSIGRSWFINNSLGTRRVTGHILVSYFHLFQEIVADGVDPKLQVFFFYSKPLKRKRLKNLLHGAKHVHPYILESNLRAGVYELLDKADDAHSSKGERARISVVSSALLLSNADPGCVQSTCGNNLAPPAMLQFAKTRKLSVERSDPRNCTLLRKRQFFHSHRAQPMAIEQVLSDRDSEDEVDDDVADFEDRRMLDDFVDVTKDEKQMMHMWNSFVRKQRFLMPHHSPLIGEFDSGKLKLGRIIEATIGRPRRSSIN